MRCLEKRNKNESEAQETQHSVCDTIQAYQGREVSSDKGGNKKRSDTLISSPLYNLHTPLEIHCLKALP